jgi:hypothetical protein
MWEPRRLTALWAFTACYRDTFFFFLPFTYILCHLTNPDRLDWFCDRPSSEFDAIHKKAYKALRKRKSGGNNKANPTEVLLSLLTHSFFANIDVAFMANM